jgi:hypothetical protein
MLELERDPVKKSCQSLFRQNTREKIRKFSVVAARRDSEIDSGPETTSLGGQQDDSRPSRDPIPPVSRLDPLIASPFLCLILPLTSVPRP